MNHYRELTSQEFAGCKTKKTENLKEPKITPLTWDGRSTLLDVLIYGPDLDQKQRKSLLLWSCQSVV